MNPKKLIAEDGGPEHVWFCGVCRVTKQSRGIAEKCCACHKCGRETPPGMVYCAPCAQVDEAERRARGVAKDLARLRRIAETAERVEPGEFVYDADDCESAYDNFDDYIDRCAEDERSPLPFVLADKHAPPDMDVGEWLTTIEEDWGAGEGFPWSSVGELVAFVEKWREGQPHLYWPDESRIVVLDDAAFESWLHGDGEVYRAWVARVTSEVE